MVCNFNSFKAFVMFVVKKLEALLIFRLCLCSYGKFFYLLPPSGGCEKNCRLEGGVMKKLTP
jgi:hypothetical protein